LHAKDGFNFVTGGIDEAPLGSTKAAGSAQAGKARTVNGCEQANALIARIAGGWSAIRTELIEISQAAGIGTHFTTRCHMPIPLRLTVHYGVPLALSHRSSPAFGTGRSRAVRICAFRTGVAGTTLLRHATNPLLQHFRRDTASHLR
jgi:hypothetical protein